MKEYIGVEIGGTKQQVGSFDENGKLIKLCSEKIKLTRGAQDVLDWMKAKIPSLITENTAALGVGFGGIVDTLHGMSYGSVQVPGWQDLPIKKWFADTFRLPSEVINDTVCGGYAEAVDGAGAGTDNFFYTNIGTGCGGAMFVKKKNFDGIGTGASYLGQVFVPSWDDAETPVKMEAVCSGVAIEKRLRTVGYVPRSSLLYEMCGGDIEKLSCREWAEAARAGDGFALSDVDRWAKTYAVALSDCLSMFAPSVIAIGGGVSNCGKTVLEPIIKHTDELCFMSMKNKYKIVQCKHLDMAVVYGAALYARDGFITL